MNPTDARIVQCRHGAAPVDLASAPEEVSRAD
jgi:hypothetical protein